MNKTNNNNAALTFSYFICDAKDFSQLRNRFVEGLNVKFHISCSKHTQTATKTHLDVKKRPPCPLQCCENMRKKNKWWLKTKHFRRTCPKSNSRHTIYITFTCLETETLVSWLVHNMQTFEQIYLKRYCFRVLSIPFFFIRVQLTREFASLLVSVRSDVTSFRAGGFRANRR